MLKNIQITSDKEIDTVSLNKGDSVIIFRHNGESEAILGAGKDDRAKDTRYAIAFCIYALSSGLLREAFELHMFDELPS